jgi:hypothetical protein
MIYLFFPGYMSTDSLNQLKQALGLRQYYDWHPPVMALVWSIGIRVTGSTGGMLVLQLSVLWASLYLLVTYIYRITKSKPLSLLPIVFGLLPFVVNIAGVIWKDVHMAFALLFATVLILYYGNSGKRTKQLLIGIITLSFVYAIMLRYNAILAVIPIAYLFVTKIDTRRLVHAGYLLALLMMAIIANMTIAVVLNVEKSNPVSSIMLDDVVNVLSIRDIDGLNIEQTIKNDLVAVKRSCESKGIVLHSYLFCSTPEQRNHTQYKYNSDIRYAWGSMLKHQSSGYIKYRIKTFGIFIAVPQSYQYITHSRIDPNNLGQSVRHPNAGQALDTYVVNVVAKDLGILFRPYFWLLLSGGLIILAKKIASRHRRMIYVLSASSIMYIIGYFPAVIAADYRYIYWSVIACSIAILLIVVDRKLNKQG